MVPDGRAIAIRRPGPSLHPRGMDHALFARLPDRPARRAGDRRLPRRDAHPDEASLGRYKELLAQHLYRPGALEVWVMNADGSGKRQVTTLGAASFAPFFHPDDRRIVFSSNHPNPRGRNFDLWMIRDDGTGLERVTTEPTFDGFPMFSPDGKTLVFASNRGGKVAGETNLFLADWVE